MSTTAPRRLTIKKAPDSDTSEARVVSQQPPPRRFIIDRGLKDDDCYEYMPSLPIAGVTIPSFDIGKKHFGAYVEQLDGEHRVCVYAGLWKIGEKMNIVTQKRLTFLLERLNPFFARAKVCLVEKQRSVNVVASRLDQASLSYFELRHPHLHVISVASDLKYRKNDGPLGDQKHKRKKWATDKSLELFDARGDPVAGFVRQLDALRKSAPERSLKSDDVCDSALQLLGWLTTLTAREQAKYLQA